MRNNLASLYEDQKKYTDALAEYENSLSIYQAICGKDSLEVAEVHEDIAMLYRIQKTYPDALSSYQKALIIY
ncbi:MAG: tetratricopeptide repeat protein [Candidatus Midichloria sp.]